MKNSTLERIASLRPEDRIYIYPGRKDDGIIVQYDRSGRLGVVKSASIRVSLAEICSAKIDIFPQILDKLQQRLYEQGV